MFLYFQEIKKTYQNWIYSMCIDQAPATSEYKFLQLKQCLAGEALKTIESLGHSAKERLEREFSNQSHLFRRASWEFQRHGKVC